MEDKVKSFEEVAGALELPSNERALYTEAVLQYAESFLTSLPEQKAYQNKEDTSDLTIPEEGRPADRFLSVNEPGHLPGLNPASGGHLGYIPGGGLYAAALGDFLAAVTNRYATVYYVSPDAVRIENTLVRWMCSLVGYSEKSFGYLSPGGSQANLSAIVAARDAKGINSKNVTKSVIYYTSQAHHCIDKAIRIAGLSEGIQRVVPVNENFQMDVVALKKIMEDDLGKGLLPWLIVASAGTTDVGAIDPLNEIAVLAQKHHVWLHVDAAYGGFFLLTETGKQKLSAVSLADSVVMDPHKGLFLPYGTGALLIKNKENLFRSFHYKANYMQDAEDPGDITSPAEISPELSRHFRGLRLWTALQIHGLKPFRAALEEKLLLAQYFYKEIRKLGFETGPAPELSIVTYRYVPQKLKNNKAAVNSFNQSLLKTVLEDGRIFISSTSLQGNFWLRLAVLSFRTHLNHIKLLLNLLREKVATANLDVEVKE